MKTIIIPRGLPLPPNKRGVQYVYEKAPRRQGKGSYRPSRYDNMAKVQTHRPPMGCFDGADTTNETKHRSLFYSPDMRSKKPEPKTKRPRKPWTVVDIPADQPMPSVIPKRTIYIRSR